MVGGRHNIRGWIKGGNMRKGELVSVQWVCLVVYCVLSSGRLRKRHIRKSFSNTIFKDKVDSKNGKRSLAFI